ncbi:hypothetical protein [Neobacillus sp. PS3-40]|uniref:hypothetical protein n=1 Tax=Neobacillus sp. PS3-40 TaxID=3070679 RepID=UPI0027E1B4F4|nr:hypothetical protein [Neobacillus sp. PS3-40]WML44997.1 hypothetical protein RCG20_03580 [Neobacillus sp. PS3-40]
MENRKKPKYKIGDTVVITMYGTVGKVTDVKWIDSKYVYEVNKSEDLYNESGIKLVTEYKGALVEKEQVDIEYKFLFGDLVHVIGYGTDLFKVVGFRSEIWRYKEDAWEDMIYELSRISDGEWLEAGEEELTLVADAESAEMIIQKLDLLHLMNKQPKPLKLVKPQNNLRKVELDDIEKKKEKVELIDHFLDIYNDYQFLFEWFKDQEFNHVMKVALKKLEAIVKNEGKSHV